MIAKARIAAYADVEVTEATRGFRNYWESIKSIIFHILLIFLCIYLCHILSPFLFIKKKDPGTFCS